MSEPHERAERGPYISGLPGFVLKVERGHGWRRAAHAGFSGLGSLWRVRRTAPFLATFGFQCKPRHSRHLGATVCALKTFTQSRGAPDELTRSRRDLIFPGFIGKFRDRVEIACAQGAFVRDVRTS